LHHFVKVLCGTSIAQYIRAIMACLDPKWQLYLPRIIKYKLTTGFSFVSGINLTTHVTNWRQPCNTCILRRDLL